MKRKFPTLIDKKIIHVCAWAKTFTQFRMPMLRKLQEFGGRQVIYCPEHKDHVAKLATEGFIIKTGEISQKLDPSIVPQIFSLYKFLKKNNLMY